MAKLLDQIWNDDKGSEFVDWIVLTAGLLMLAVAAAAVIDTSTTLAAGDAVSTAAGV